jgi:hypothetical protein
VALKEAPLPLLSSYYLDNLISQIFAWHSLTIGQIFSIQLTVLTALMMQYSFMIIVMALAISISFQLSTVDWPPFLAD